MVGAGILLVGLLLSTFVAVPAMPIETRSVNCTSSERLAGLCATVSGDAVEIGATVTTPGGTPRVRTIGGGNGAPVALPIIWKCMDNTGCDETTPGTSPVTLSDLASFRPVTGSQYMQPNGWMVVGLDANFYVDSTQHLITGALLGQATTVRFTPVAFRWDYGDGTVGSRSSAGATWAALGIREFDATPTSHVYDTAGTYTVRLSVSYAAEYSVGGSAFVPVAGRVTVPVNELQVTVGSATTVLVDRDCAAQPGGPGC